MNTHYEGLNELNNTTISYEEYTLLCNDYVKWCRTVRDDVPVRGKDHFKRHWSWGDERRAEFRKLVEVHAIKVEDPILEKLHDFKLTKSGFERLSELSKLTNS